MTFVSLFAGVGGFDLAFHRAGHECVGQCELDPHARAILHAQWPDTPKHPDVTTLRGDEWIADIVTFGSPCQDLSIAGRRAGITGSQSGLFLEATRIIREMKEATDGEHPTYAVWENVPGAFSSNDGRDFAVVLRELARVGALDIAWRVLDSRHFGVPQRRRRIFLVADFGGERAHEVLFEPKGVQGHPAAGRSEREDVAGTLEAHTGAGGFPGTDGAAAGHAVAAAVTARKGKGPDSDATTTLVAFDWQAGPQHGMNEGKTVPTLQVSAGQGRAAIAFSGKDHGADAGGIAPTLRAMGHDKSHVNGGGQVAVAFEPRYYTRDQGGPPLHGHTHALMGRGRGDIAQHVTAATELDTRPYQGDRVYGRHDQWPTLPAQSANNGGGPGAVFADPEPHTVRRLTPRECERLQGFPDDWTRYRPDGTEVADTHRYRMMGNAVTVPVAQWIGRRLA